MKMKNKIWIAFGVFIIIAVAYFLIAKPQLGQVTGIDSNLEGKSVKLPCINIDECRTKLTSEQFNKLNPQCNNGICSGTIPDGYYGE